MKYFIFTLLISASFSVKASVYNTNKSFKILCLYSDTTRAQPNIGMRKFYQKWSNYAKYTKEARKSKIEGRVFVKFIVNKDGSLSNFEITKSLGYGLDEITIEAIKKCGKWKPKEIDGLAISEIMIMPFTFKLR